jgi:hypothetical protein
VTDGPGGRFYSAYQARGGKAMLGDPLSRPGPGPRGREQFFDGMVLAVSRPGAAAAGALPIVAMLARDAPAAYRRAALPPVQLDASAATRRGWLTSPGITRAYLGGKPLTNAGYAAAVRRYGPPLGPPAASGAWVRQAFAGAVLEVPARGGSARAVAVTPVALAAGVLRIPAGALVPQPPPPLPEPDPSGPPEPTSAQPFALTLAAALFLYGAGADALAARRARGPW